MAGAEEEGKGTDGGAWVVPCGARLTGAAENRSEPSAKPIRFSLLSIQVYRDPDASSPLHSISISRGFGTRPVISR